GGINISGVIEHGTPQSSTHKRRGNPEREAQFGIEDHKLLSAHWHFDFYAAVGIVRRTDRNVALRSSPVQAEAAQRAAAACVEKFTNGNVSASKCVFHSQPQAIGPHK